MKFFKYAENGTNDLSTMYDIFCSIRSLENYAKKIYKNRWEDALDDALFHMLRNYDPSKGPIDNYAIKLVKTIKKNEFGYEKPSEYITELGDESQEDVPDTVERVEEIKEEIARSVELQNCIKDMAKHFVRDFRFFCSMKANVRKDSYSDVFEKYSHKVIKESIDYLKGNYTDKVKRVYDAKKACGGKPFDGAYPESGIKYLCEINGTVIYERERGGLMRYIYVVDLKKIISELMLRFYSEEGSGFCMVEGASVYCTLTGGIVFSLGELCKRLSDDIVGLLTARTTLKPFWVVDEDKAFFVSSSDSVGSLNITAFGELVWLVVERKSAKEIIGGFGNVKRVV